MKKLFPYIFILCLLFGKDARAKIFTSFVGPLDLRPVWRHRFEPGPSSREPQSDDFFRLKVREGLLRMEVRDFALRDEQDLFFSYEPRLVFPDVADRWDGGMIFIARSVFKLSHNVSPRVKISLKAIPSFHFYERPGRLTDYGHRANRVFQNQIKLATEISIIGDKLMFYLPVVLQQAKYAAYRAGARFNDRWRHSLWISPDITYYFSPSTFLSLAYESESLVTSSLSRFDILGGLGDGSVSAYFQIAI